MSYIKPSVLVYQDLQTSGGVLNSTPDLEACIIGPLYQVLTYVPGSLSSQVQTAALSTTSVEGSIEVDSSILTVASIAGLSEGDNLLIIGAGASGSTLQANVVDIAGTQITLDTSAKTTVTDTTVTKSGKIANPSIANTFVLPSRKVGQEVEESSIVAWFNNAKVQTLVSSFEGLSNSNSLGLIAPSTSGTISSGSNSLTLTAVSGLIVGDVVRVSGAGVSGGILEATINNLVGNVATLSVSASTSVTSQVVTKVVPTNLSPTTNSLRVEAGDEVIVSYTNSSSVNTTFSSTVYRVTTSSGLNGLLSNVTLVDILPSDVSVETSGTVSAASSALTVASTTGFINGSKVLVKGAGPGGVDLTATVTGVSGSILTLSTAASTAVTSAQVLKYTNLHVSIRKVFQNQQLPSVKPITGGASLNTASAGTLGTVTVNPGPELAFGPVISADVYLAYKALRQDLAERVVTINDASDLEGQFGVSSDENPLALATKLALANTITRVRAIAVKSNDLSGYLEAFETAEGERLYAIVPLTQDLAILNALKAHVTQLSTPENASWRVGIVNTAIPRTENIGTWSEGFPNVNSGNNSIVISDGNFVLTSSNSTFISDGVAPGDIVRISAGSPSSVVGGHQVLNVVSNQQLIIGASSTATGVEFYVERSLSKTQSAAAVKATSENFASNRIWHIQPDIVGISIDGVVKYLPGYYLAAAHSGMVAGFPVQQGFTNIGVAGISDLKNSNFFFSKAELNSMAEGGTNLYVQDTQGGIPYVRHELTTDVTVLEYREQLIVKNWDFLSYFYYDKLKGFIGSWNITPDTINVIRQTVIASSELIKSKKLPRIGAPLLGYEINSIAQNPNNKDNLDAYVRVELVYPLNYLNLHLVI